MKRKSSSKVQVPHHLDLKTSTGVNCIAGIVVVVANFIVSMGQLGLRHNRKALYDKTSDI